MQLALAYAWEKWSWPLTVVARVIYWNRKDARWSLITRFQQGSKWWMRCDRNWAYARFVLVPRELGKRLCRFAIFRCSLFLISLVKSAIPYSYKQEEKGTPGIRWYAEHGAFLVERWSYFVNEREHRIQSPILTSYISVCSSYLITRWRMFMRIRVPINAIKKLVAKYF